MSDFVLDASVAVVWILDNPIAPYAIAVRRALASGKRGLVLALWHLEIANGLATAMRRRHLIGTDLDDALTTIQATVAQAIDTEMNFIPVGEVLANARSFQLTAYDAVYLDLARRARLPLANLCKTLPSASATAGGNAMA